MSARFCVEFLCPRCRGQNFSSRRSDDILWRRCTSDACTYTAAEHDDHLHFVVRYETLHGYKEREEEYMRSIKKDLSAAIEKKKEPPPDPKKKMN
jgi:Zn-finger nucleic acid-binding protein